MLKLICGNEPIYQQKNLHMKQHGTVVDYMEILRKQF